MDNNVVLKSLLARMKGHEFDLFRLMLTEMKENCLRGLARETDSMVLYRLQGEVKALTQVLDLVTENRTQGQQNSTKRA